MWSSPLSLSPASLAVPKLTRASTCFPPSSLSRSSRSFLLSEPPSPLRSNLLRRRKLLTSASASAEDTSSSEYSIQTLRVPETWLSAPNAIEESEWLRTALHKWLDDEFCPEETNVAISEVAARSYQESLLSGNPDVGDVLLKMVVDLQSLSYQESFHGPFSAANAAVRLITERMQSSL